MKYMNFRYNNSTWEEQIARLNIILCICIIPILENLRVHIPHASMFLQNLMSNPARANLTQNASDGHRKARIRRQSDARRRHPG